MQPSNKRKNESSGADRRRHLRVPADGVPELSARLIGGPPVRLLDISRRGAQLETSMLLGPGRAVTIRFVAADTTLTLTGAVVRSSVAELDGETVKYHTALSFTEDVLVCPGVNETVSISAEADAYNLGNIAESDDILTVVATTGESGAALRGRLFANSW